MTDNLTPTGNAEMRIVIEIGENVQTTQRVKDAIAELANALTAADAEEVSGFALTGLKSGSLLFDSRIGKVDLSFDRIWIDKSSSDGSHRGFTEKPWP